MQNLHLIHAGYHRTASTWLQRGFFASLADVHRPSRAAITQALIAPHALHFDPGEARHRLAPTRQRVVLSMEALSGYPHNAGLNGCLAKDVASRLQRTFPDAHVMFVIRSQPEVISASYAQYVRRGGTASPNAYLWPQEAQTRYRADKAPRFSVEHFDYLPLLRLYRELFGAERVFVYLYEALRADPEAFLERLAVDHGLARRPGTHAIGSGRRKASWPPALLRLARLLNHFTAREMVGKRYWLHVPGAYLLTRGICEGLHHLLPQSGSDPERVLGVDNTAWLRAHYAASNRRLARELDLPLGGHGYPGCEADAPAGERDGERPRPEPRERGSRAASGSYRGG